MGLSEEVRGRGEWKVELAKAWYREQSKSKSTLTATNTFDVVVVDREARVPITRLRWFVPM